MGEARVCEKRLLGMAGEVISAETYGDRTDAVTMALYLCSRITEPCVIQVVNKTNGVVDFKRVD